MLRKITHLVSAAIYSLFGQKTLKKEEAGNQNGFLELCGTSRFFWPNISRQNAEEALRDKTDGTFLVWNNRSRPRETLELLYKREGDIMNMKIDYNGQGFSLDHKNPNLPRGESLDGLILMLVSKCKDHSLVVTDETRQQFGLLKLKFPLVRNVTLMDHCRKAILSSHPCTNYESMNLPRELTVFLKGERQSPAINAAIER